MILESRVVPTVSIHPNPWNINRMTDRLYLATRDSIRTHGFVDPVTVRRHPELPDAFQILDGEHRWKAAREEGLPELAVVILDLPEDFLAQKLSLILNQGGSPDRLALGKLLADLQTRLGAEATRGLAISGEELATLLSLAAAEWPSYTSPEPTEPDRTSWETMQVLCPTDAAAEIERAVDAAQHPGEDRYLALIRLCDDYKPSRP